MAHNLTAVHQPLTIYLFLEVKTFYEPNFDFNEGLKKIISFTSLRKMRILLGIFNLSLFARVHPGFPRPQESFDVPVSRGTATMADMNPFFLSQLGSVVTIRVQYPFSSAYRRQKRAFAAQPNRSNKTQPNEPKRNRLHRILTWSAYFFFMRLSFPRLPRGTLW